MSAKKNKKKNGKKALKWGIIVLEVVILLAALLIWWALEYDGDAPAPTVPTESVAPETTATVPQVTVPEPTIEEMVEVEGTSIGNGLAIINIGSYTGAYVEDGTNEIVSGVLMLVVENIGEEAIQYAEITLPTDNGDAKFTLSTLPAGESIVLLEQTRMEYTGEEDASQAASDNVAVFSEPMSLHEEQLKLQILDGAINVTNISGEDIDGDIVIYYKNAASDIYYGGITYRVRIEGGMKTDEIKQIMASHFSDTGSKIMFVTVG